MPLRSNKSNGSTAGLTVVSHIEGSVWHAADSNGDRTNNWDDIYVNKDALSGMNDIPLPVGSTPQSYYIGTGNAPEGNPVIPGEPSTFTNEFSIPARHYRFPELDRLPDYFTADSITKAEIEIKLTDASLYEAGYTMWIDTDDNGQELTNDPGNYWHATYDDAELVADQSLVVTLAAWKEDPVASGLYINPITSPTDAQSFSPSGVWQVVDATQMAKDYLNNRNSYATFQVLATPEGFNAQEYLVTDGEAEILRKLHEEFSNESTTYEGVVGVDDYAVFSGSITYQFINYDDIEIGELRVSFAPSGVTAPTLGLVREDLPEGIKQ